MKPDEPQENSPRWWCNFCGFSTEDREAYLAHSCRDELARQGRDSIAGPERNCR